MKPEPDYSKFGERRLHQDDALVNLMLHAGDETDTHFTLPAQPVDVSREAMLRTKKIVEWAEGYLRGVRSEDLLEEAPFNLRIINCGQLRTAAKDVSYIIVEQQFSDSVLVVMGNPERSRAVWAKGKDIDAKVAYAHERIRDYAASPK